MILGAGYAGVTLARQLANKGLGNHVTLVNDRPHHQLVTLLHKVAAGTLPPNEATLPLESLLHATGVKLKVGRVKEIDPNRQRVALEDGELLTYDRLVVALGSEPETFGIPGVEEHTFALQPIEAAVAGRNRIEEVFQSTPTERGDKIRIAVVGSGLTGVELAGELADRLPPWVRGLALRPDYEIVLIEAMDDILPGFPKPMVQRVRRLLRRRGVTIRTGTPLTAVQADGVTFQSGEFLPADAIFWAGGVRGNRIVEAAFPTNPRGRAVVDPYLRATGYPNVYVIGDTALAIPAGTNRPAAPTGQNAVLQAKCVAKNLAAEAHGQPLKVYEDLPLGVVLSVGIKDAVAEVPIGGIWKAHFAGWPAYLLKQASETHYRVGIGAA